jgi:peptide/nickel transport system ATP-binding protein
MNQVGHPLLDLRGLEIGFRTASGQRLVVDGVDLQLARGETFALVGESGSGKSLTALALMRLLPPNSVLAAEHLQVGEEEVLRLAERDMRQLRGGRMAMIFQEPATSLNPVLTVGTQIGEALVRHRGLRGEAARKEALALLRAVGIADAARRIDEYPFQMSGGMKQRVMIAIALAGNPELLIADEPTTALDVTIQAEILALLDELQRSRGMAMLMITHDLGVVRRMAHRVGVMYAGQLVETGPAESFFASPRHPYAHGLFGALPGVGQRRGELAAIAGQPPEPGAWPPGCRFAPRCRHRQARCDAEVPAWTAVGDEHQVRCHFAAEIARLVPAPVQSASAAEEDDRGRTGAEPLLTVEDLAVHFPIRRGLLQRTVGHVRAVDGVSFALVPGRTLALVGESGCGKTTVGKALMRLIASTGGRVRLNGLAVPERGRAALKPLRRSAQMVFQDPFASLNPKRSVGEIIDEGIDALGTESAAQRAATIEMVLESVGLPRDAATRYPHEFSGGQRQRIAIARALAVRPQVLICDEPTSALDVSVQAQVLNLLRRLQRERGLAYLFITHNFGVVEYLADEVAVMYLGRIVEQGSAARILSAPRHPYTQALLASVPKVDGGPAGTRLAGEIPSPSAPPAGCHFHPRCPRAAERCRREYPETQQDAAGHRVRCHFPLDSSG